MELILAGNGFQNTNKNLKWAEKKIEEHWYNEYLGKFCLERPFAMKIMSWFKFSKNLYMFLKVSLR